MKPFRTLVLVTAILAFFVVLKGAYTRLVDAGLGCPDWPGCYGFVLPPQATEDQAIANAKFPERPVEIAKAWPEMIHRYMATALGLFILAIAYVAFRKRAQGYPWKLGLALVPLVIFQGLLGKWTVTMGLFPPIVMGHLLGGFLIVSLLLTMFFNLCKPALKVSMVDFGKTKLIGSVAFIALFLQIALGGWTSANYAALVCSDLPICEQGWQQSLDFENAFSVGAEGVTDYEFGVLPAKARLTIHVMHRIGAIIASCMLLLFLFFLYKQEQFRTMAAVIGFLLLVQVVLGVSNVKLQLPLAVAVAHNGVAALLMTGMMIVLNRFYKLREE